MEVSRFGVDFEKQVRITIGLYGVFGIVCLDFPVCGGGVSLQVSRALRFLGTSGGG